MYCIFLSDYNSRTQGQMKYTSLRAFIIVFVASVRYRSFIRYKTALCTRPARKISLPCSRPKSRKRRIETIANENVGSRDRMRFEDERERERESLSVSFGSCHSGQVSRQNRVIANGYAELNFNFVLARLTSLVCPLQC